MSKNTIQALEIFRTFLIVGALVILSSPNPARAESIDTSCVDAIPVNLNSSLRGYGDTRSGPFFVKLEVPSTGILSVNVATSGSAMAEPKLGFAGPGCELSKADFEPTILERSATHLVLVAPKPGPYVFRVASQAPGLPLHELKFSTRFAPTTTLQPFSIKGGEDEEEIELEPDPLLHTGQGDGRSLPSRLHELCRRGEVDDHGDSFACASFLSLGQGDMVGEIHNDWGDDDDVFLFVLGGYRQANLWSLEIETTGDVDTLGVLYDQSGQRLEQSNDGGHGANFRLARTLGPGTYFVRVQGRQGAEGSYALSVDATPW